MSSLVAWAVLMDLRILFPWLLENIISPICFWLNCILKCQVCGSQSEWWARHPRSQRWLCPGRICCWKIIQTQSWTNLYHWRNSESQDTTIKTNSRRLALWSVYQNDPRIGSIRITEGAHNRNLPKGESIPAGWHRGMTKRIWWCWGYNNPVPLYWVYQWSWMNYVSRWQSWTSVSGRSNGCSRMIFGSRFWTLHPGCQRVQSLTFGYLGLLIPHRGFQAAEFVENQHPGRRDRRISLNGAVWHARTRIQKFAKASVRRIMTMPQKEPRRWWQQRLIVMASMDPCLAPTLPTARNIWQRWSNGMEKIGQRIGMMNARRIMVEFIPPTHFLIEIPNKKSR